MGFLKNLFTTKGQGYSQQFYTNQLTWNNSPYAFKRFSPEFLMERSYLSNPDAYAIIQKISEVGSSLPLNVVNQDNEIIENHPLDGVLKKPNPKQTIKQFMSESMIYLLTTGNLFIEKTEVIGFGTSNLQILNTALMTINVDSDWNIIDYEYQDGRTSSRKIPEEDIIHVKYLDPTPYGDQCHFGLSPIQAGYMNIRSSNNSYEANAHILENKGASGMLVGKADAVMTPDEAKQIKASIDKKIKGTKNAGAITITDKELAYLQLGMSPTDLQLLEGNVVNLRTTCNLFSVDSSLFNDPANKTYNNRLEAEKALYSNAVLPVLDKILSALNMELLENDMNKIKPDISKVAALQDDLNTESERLTKLVQAGIMTIDEAREELNLTPLGNTPNQEEE